MLPGRFGFGVEPGDAAVLGAALITLLKSQLQDLLPKDLRYFQYLGSLTSPPCTEGVLRLVLQKPATVSREQWQLLTRMAPSNARPTQALHGRRVREAQ